MCGFTGFLDRAGGGEAELRQLAAAMADAMRHRGPDGGGAWADGGAGIAFGHRRLAIVDLSPAGHQPMDSGCGACVITYNGEIYNAAELRAELAAAGRRFRGHSDTEVLVEACALWGVAATVRRLIGMFAFALWDRRDRTLTLARDRLGIKPVYWAAFGGTLMFGSELKALRVHPAFVAERDRAALAAFLRLGWVPAPATIYRGVAKLPPGSLLVAAPGRPPVIETWWSAVDVARAAIAARRPIAPADAVEQLDQLLRDAVRRRLVADVPLGAFLSGGVDSSCVVALMQAESARPVRTFTIGFDDPAYDEAAQAAAVAAHLGTDHLAVTVTPDDARALIPDLPEWWDEPFADASQLPTRLVSAVTRRHVTVALSGDGGDELFAGYNRHAWGERLWRRLGRLPVGPRRAAAAALRALGPEGWDALFGLVPAGHRPRQAGDKVHKLASVLAAPDQAALYRGLVSLWPDPAALVPGAGETPLAWELLSDPAVPGLAERMQLLDTIGYLPDDILTKVDRASMAVALEARVPLLDHRVVEFAWTLPPELKRRDGQSKWVLRRVLDRYVPRALVERPKMGFAVPLHAWLRGPLRDWAEDLLAEPALLAGGITPAPVRRLWAEHLAGGRNHQYPLWAVLMAQAWSRRWLGG